jgi:DNA-binding response OmpR family regulator
MEMMMIRQFDTSEDERRKLLLVDAGQELQSALDYKLKEAGFTVVRLSRGADALRMVEEEAPCMVIIDPKLIDMNGVKLGALLSEKAEVPFLFLTSGSTKSYQEAAVAVGAITILSKKSHPEDLVTQIQLAVERANEFADTVTLNKRLTEKLVRSEKRENLIGAYMEIWGEDKARVKSKLNRFARSKNISIDELAEIHNEHSVKAREIREEFGKKLQSIQPEIINDLSRYDEVSAEESEVKGVTRRAVRSVVKRLAPSSGA